MNRSSAPSLTALKAECAQCGFAALRVINVRDHRDNTPCQIVLIVNIGDTFWVRFARAAEYSDSLPDKVDRYSARVLSSITPQGAELIMPNSRPYPPLQAWAKTLGDLHNSPLGLLIHPEYGLWFAFRGALRFPANTFPATAPAPQSAPCASCVDKPCLNTCPVQAFQPEGFRVQDCRNYLHKQPNPCADHQCQARLACPVGAKYRYAKDCGRFFLRQFAQSMNIA